jgi:hypothetical protein
MQILIKINNICVVIKERSILTFHIRILYFFYPILFTYNYIVIAVQHERGPRNSTIRRQMALLMKESNEILSNVYRTTPNLFSHFMPPTNIQPPVIPPTPPTPNETILEPNCTSSSSSSSTSNFTLPNISPNSQDFSNVFNSVAAAALSQPLMSPLILQQQQQQQQSKVS